MAEELQTLLGRAWEEDSTVSAVCVEDAVVTGFHLAGLEFTDVVLRNCRFTDCDFTGASFYRTTFEHCAMDLCHFQNTFWKDTAVTGSRGEGCNFHASTWHGCTLEDDFLRYANFSRAVWNKCLVRRCNLQEACLAEMRLTRTAWESVDLTAAEVFRTALKGMDLSGCTIDKIVVSQDCAELRGAAIAPAQAMELARILGIQIR